MCVLIYEEDWKRRQLLEQHIARYRSQDNGRLQVKSFNNPQKALAHARDNPVMAAFISMEDKFGHGFFLARHLKKENPRLNLIPMADEPRFERELIGMCVSGYLIGDCTREKVKKELDNLRYEISM